MAQQHACSAEGYHPRDHCLGHMNNRELYLPACRALPLKIGGMRAFLLDVAYYFITLTLEQ